MRQLNVPAHSDTGPNPFGFLCIVPCFPCTWVLPDFVNQRTCADIEVAPWNGSATMVMPSSKNSHGAGGAAMINLAPLFEGVALLGELGKVTAVSSHRFTDVSAAGGTLTVSLRGQAGESVLLAFAKSRPGTAAVGCSVRTVRVSVPRPWRLPWFPSLGRACATAKRCPQRRCTKQLCTSSAVCGVWRSAWRRCWLLLGHALPPRVLAASRQTYGLLTLHGWTPCPRPPLEATVPLLSSLQATNENEPPALCTSSCWPRRAAFPSNRFRKSPPYGW